MKNLQRAGALDFQMAEAQGNLILAAKNRLQALIVEKLPSSERRQMSSSLISACRCTVSKRSHRCRYWAMACTETPPCMSLNRDHPRIAQRGRPLRFLRLTSEEEEEEEKKEERLPPAKAKDASFWWRDCLKCLPAFKIFSNVR
jgi:hypothetical protein